LLCVFARPLRLESQSSSPLQLRYHLRLLRPTTHLMEVEITADQVTTPRLDFMMPAWAPGRYAIYDFAKNVQEFSASGLQGQALAWTKLDKQTWRVEAHDGANKPISTVQVHYRIFANDLSGSFSQFDRSHADLNGASIFMYIAGHKRDSLSLSVETPPGANPPWKIISGFSLATEQRTFEVPNYDLLADTPMEISAECVLAEFREGGKTFRVAVHSYPEPTSDPSRLVEGLKKIVRSEMAMMPAPEFDRYTFIFHFAPDIPLGDGMEHLNSTQIVIRGSLDGDGLAEAQEIAAHEFFHLWNVKRLRPAVLGPFDYSRENYTPSLWFAEGVTSYYAYLHLLRAGIWTRPQFLKRLAKEVRDLEAEPGRALMSAETSSFNAWFYDRSPQMQETNFANSTVSYYNKGLLLGLLLDLEIRSRTNGQKSLDDVLLSMYRKFYESPAASPDPVGASDYGPGRGYEERDILEALSNVSGSDFKPFFRRYIQETDPLPYASTLALAGLELRVAVAAGSAPSLGVLTQRLDQGLRIVAVRPGGAADRGGLSRDDILTEVDNVSLSAEELDERLKIYPPGAEVPLTVLRHGREERITVTLDPPAPNAYSIEELPEATPARVKIRDGWLGK
jgi:predicted metalloprotease with PDZ domain